MYSTCLYCTRNLGTNEVLETLPIGRRIAFDAHKGRLWVVCRKCAKWNLVPFDTRMESIDDCERLYRDANKRYSTDNIGLAKVREGLELVRIGEPMRPEFAAWRYGDHYRARRRVNIAVGTVGIIGSGLGTFLIGFAGSATGAGGFYLGLAATRELIAHQARKRTNFNANDPETGEHLQWKREELMESGISWPGGGEPQLLVRRPFSWDRFRGIAAWKGTEVKSVGRKVLGKMNGLVGTRRDLQAGADLLGEHSGDLSQWLKPRAEQQVALRRGKGVLNGGNTIDYGWNRRHDLTLELRRLPAGERMAIEMWMNEDVERVYLEGELKLLEREWREADELAGIADKLALESVS